MWEKTLLLLLTQPPRKVPHKQLCLSMWMQEMTAVCFALEDVHNFQDTKVLKVRTCQKEIASWEFGYARLPVTSSQASSTSARWVRLATLAAPKGVATWERAHVAWSGTTELQRRRCLIWRVAHTTTRVLVCWCTRGGTQMKGGELGGRIPAATYLATCWG